MGKYAIVVYTSATQDRIEKVESNDLVFGFAAGEWYAMEYKGAATECVFPDSVQEAGYVLTDYLFYDCKGLTKVSLTDKATRLEEYVFKGSEVGEVLFQGDSALTFSADAFSESAVAKIDFAERAFETVEAETFTDCAFLQEVSFPSALKRIGANAFAECMHLKKVVCEGIVRVEERAFYNCIRLSQFTFGDDLLTVGVSAFNGCSLLGGTLSCEKLEEVGDLAFAGCGLEKIVDCTKLNKIGRAAFDANVNLTEVSGCDSLSVVDATAFYSCYNLKTLELPDSLTSIGVGAFMYCQSLTSVDIPEGITSIAISTFSGCVKLEKVYLPTTLTAIGEDAFTDCDALHEVYNLSSLPLVCDSTTYGKVAYNAVAIHDDRADALERTTIGGIVYKYSAEVCAIVDCVQELDTVTIDFQDFTADRYVVARYAFKANAAIATLKIGEKVDEIRTYAFPNAYYLERVQFAAADSLSVKKDVFQECHALTSIIVSTGLGGIESGAFRGTRGMITIYYEGTQSSWNNSGVYRYRFDTWTSTYYYDACAHYDKQWKYTDGQVDASNKEFSIVTYDPAPTCTTSGVMIQSCPDCSEKKSVVVSQYGHDLIDGECSRCDYFRFSVNQATVTGLAGTLSVANDEEHPFDLFEKSFYYIYAPSGTNFTSTLTITAERDLYLSYSCYKPLPAVTVTVQKGTSTVALGARIRLLKGESLTITCSVPESFVGDASRIYFYNISVCSE